MNALADVVNDLTKVKQECYHKEVIQKVKDTTVALVDLVKKPKVMIETALKNFVENAEAVGADITKAANDSKAGKDYDFGKDMGDIVHILLLGSNELVFKSSADGVIGFLDGFYRKAYVHEDIQCYKKGVMESGKLAMSGIEALKKKELKKALDYLTESLENLNSTLKECFESTHWDYM